MSFRQKLHLWLQSGGDITRLWKYCLVITLVLYPIGLIVPAIGNFWSLVMALAVVGTFLLLAGLSVKGKARIEAEEHLKVKEERDAKKREGR
jgi:formate hydrogenlyase subunit 4